MAHVFYLEPATLKVDGAGLVLGEVVADLAFDFLLNQIGRVVSRDKLVRVMLSLKHLAEIFVIFGVFRI